MANSVYFLWNQFWPYFHACMLLHKRQAAQKADLHFAMQCKFLVSKYLFVFKSKWCWLGLSDRNPKASMISSFIVLLCHWFIFYLDYSTHSLQYTPLCHTYIVSVQILSLRCRGSQKQCPEFTLLLNRPQTETDSRYSNSFESHNGNNKYHNALPLTGTISSLKD